MRKLLTFAKSTFALFIFLFSFTSGLLTYFGFFFGEYSSPSGKHKLTIMASIFIDFLHQANWWGICTLSLVIFATLSMVKLIAMKETDNAKKELTSLVNGTFKSLNEDQIKRIDTIEKKIQSQEFYNSEIGIKHSTNLLMMVREVVIPKVFANEGELVKAVEKYPYFSLNALSMLGFSKNVNMAAAIARERNEIEMKERNIEQQKIKVKEMEATINASFNRT